MLYLGESKLEIGVAMPCATIVIIMHTLHKLQCPRTNSTVILHQYWKCTHVHVQMRYKLGTYPLASVYVRNKGRRKGVWGGGEGRGRPRAYM